MLEEIIAISQIEVTETNIVQVRTSTLVMEDGVQLSETYHRHCIAPGDDYSQEDAEVQAVCASAHTPEAIAAYLALTAPPVLTLEELLAKTRVMCSEYMSAKLAAGFVYGGNTYQVDGDAQDNIGKRATYAGWSKLDPLTFPWVDPYSLGWWDIVNVWHPMTAEEFMLFAKAVSDYVSECAACCRNHKNLITPENCATYDYTTGWPVNP